MKIIQITAADTWPIRKQVMWPDRPIDYVKLEQDEKGQHYALTVGEHVVSIVSLFYEDNKAQFRKFATLTSEQGKGYGSRLLQYVLAEAAQQPIDAIWCNARLDKSGYYERFGLKKTDRTFTKGGISYVIMDKKLT